jgi:hypothetical protein
MTSLSRCIACCSKQLQERADLVPVLRMVAEVAGGVDDILVPAADAVPGDVAGILQVGDDQLHGALGEPGPHTQVPHSRSRVAGDLHQDVTVPERARQLARTQHLALPVPGRRRPAGMEMSKIEKTHAVGDARRHSSKPGDQVPAAMPGPVRGNVSRNQLAVRAPECGEVRARSSADDP